MSARFALGFSGTFMWGVPATLVLTTRASRTLRTESVHFDPIWKDGLARIEVPDMVTAGETAEIAFAYNGHQPEGMGYHGVDVLDVVLFGREVLAPAPASKPVTRPNLLGHHRAAVRGAIDFLRETFRNDGAEGESVHLVCDALEPHLDALPFPGWICPVCGGFNGEAKDRRPACRACDALRPSDSPPPEPSQP